MARGSQEQNRGSLFFLKVAGAKKGEQVHFKISQAVEGADPTPLDNIRDISGKFYKAEVGEYIWEGDKVQYISLWLRDTEVNEMYIISCGLNRIGKNLINTLCNIEGEIGKIAISLYNNKEGYASASITHNGEKSGWMWSPNEFKPMVKKVVIKGKEQNDSYELDQFLLRKFSEIVVPKSKRRSDVQAEPQTESHADPEKTLFPESAPADVTSAPTGDDLPF